MYQPKSREEYIAQCRYYKGEPMDEEALGENYLLACYEKYWVEEHYTADGLHDLKCLIKDYKEFGLGHFNPNDGAPIALKALIWSRYMHWGSGYETPDTFKQWWRRFYLKMNEEYYQEKCRFYRGEDRCPASIAYDIVKASAWKMESYWVREMVENGQIPSEYSYSYHKDGLSNFSKDDGVPQSLKEFFYGYGLHKAEGMMTIEEFKEWYNQYKG